MPLSFWEKEQREIEKKIKKEKLRDAERIARYIKNSKEFDNYTQRGFDKDGRFCKDGKIYKEK